LLDTTVIRGDSPVGLGRLPTIVFSPLGEANAWTLAELRLGHPERSPGHPERSDGSASIPFVVAPLLRRHSWTRALSPEFWALSLELADSGPAVARRHRDFQRELQL